jgi:hypothetical protein
MDIAYLTKEFGLLGLTIGSTCTMFGLVIKWICDRFNEELKSNRSDRREYLTILGEMKSEMRDHNERAKESHTATQLEHKEMITVLGRINGYKS